MLFLVQGFTLAATLVGPPIGIAALKNLGYREGGMIGLLISTVSSVFIAWMPSVAKQNHRHVIGGQEEILEVNGGPTMDEPGAEQLEQSWYHRLLSKINSSFSQIVRVCELVLGNSSLRIGMIILVCTKVSDPLVQLMPQYTSKRFGWTLGDVSLPHSISSVRLKYYSALQ